MELLTVHQYNQGIGKNKLLSSTAGVGAIITTKIGYYILVSDINKWEFVRKAQRLVIEIRYEEPDNIKRYSKARARMTHQGITFIDDKRFVDFLRSEKNLAELLCLVAIPNIALNEQFNSPNWKNHPINKLLEGNAKAEDFMVKGTHFPKWFLNDKGDLRTYAEWKNLWTRARLGVDRFVPPRDASKPIIDQKGNIKEIVQKNDHDGETRFPLYTPLTQTNLILICPNGHLSDIPWPKFLKWKSQRREKNDHGQILLSSSAENCCPTPNLKWTESKTKSEGYSSIYIECMSCGCGSGDNKVNLEGINNFKPHCSGHKPWEVDLAEDAPVRIPWEDCFREGDVSKGREAMQVALVTGNNVYYASIFSSLFIPQNLALNKSNELIEAKIKCEQRFEKFVKVKPGFTKQEFWDQKIDEDFLIENDFIVDDKVEFFKSLKEDFLGLSQNNQDEDPHEVFRWQEYQCFTRNSRINEDLGLRFVDIEMPAALSKYFGKIQQVEELKLTNVQLDFTRVRPNERIRVANEIRTSATGQNIYSIDENELFVLPANEIYGEGLFFEFRTDAILAWMTEKAALLETRFKHFTGVVDFGSQGASTKQRIKNNGYKHFLIHTFSHALMRELEFSCGYPTASLKERLYISERMSGVLIFTAEGSEGSMGGLIWQGNPKRIQKLIVSALIRAIDCSSDPLCWESEGQGLFDLNLSACFSCSLTSETACEESNLGLDRRVLVDSEFGYFSDLI